MTFCWPPSWLWDLQWSAIGWPPSIFGAMSTGYDWLARTKSDWTGLQSYSKKCVLADKEVPTIHACVIYLFPKNYNEILIEIFFIIFGFLVYSDWIVSVRQKKRWIKCKISIIWKRGFSIRKCSHSHGRRAWRWRAIDYKPSRTLIEDETTFQVQSVRASLQKVRWASSKG